MATGADHAAMAGKTGAAGDRPAATAASPCRVLHHQRNCFAAGRQVATHRHPFWQFEYVHAGRACALLQSGEIVLDPGWGLLLPAGLEHGFRYDRAQTRTLSIKFAASVLLDQPRPLPPAAFLAALVAALEAVFPGDHQSPDDDPLTAGLLLAALLRHVLDPGRGDHPDSGDPLVDRVLIRLREHPAEGHRVESLAAWVELSPGRLSARCRAATGQPLKAWIDRLRAEEAARLLRYSDLDIGGIAQLLGFDEAFAFSRFCRRTLGTSPRAWRKAQK